MSEGSAELRSLPAGGLEKLVSTAASLMKQEGAYLWALSPSNQDRNLAQSVNMVSRSLGLANGSFYGFINRPSCKALLPCLGSAAEDCERSARFFQQDKIIIRFLGYAAMTTPFKHIGGLLTEFGTNTHRKEAELKHVEAL